MQNCTALIDCNSFYVSCERLFRPELHNKPVIVLSNNDGCAVSLSNEAKSLGLNMTDPFFKIEKLLKRHGVHVFSSNYPLYGDVSRRVIETLKHFTDKIDIYSIDEAFIELTLKAPEEAEQLGREIRRRVYKDVGLPVSVGLAPTKALSKIANQVAKKNSDFKGSASLIDSSVRNKILETYSVVDIWGIGRQSAYKLFDHHIETAAQLRDADSRLIQKLLTIQGRRLQEELNGVSCIDVADLQQKKAVLSSRSFGKPIRKMELLKEALAFHIGIIGEKLRKQKSLCRGLRVSLRTSHYSPVSRFASADSVQFLSGKNLTSDLLKEANQILEKIYESGHNFRKIGVLAFDLVPESARQLNIFHPQQNARTEELFKAADKINNKYGQRLVQVAPCFASSRDWKMQQAHRSPDYTTSWKELPKAKGF